jgi:hypothetical protein
MKKALVGLLLMLPLVGCFGSEEREIVKATGTCKLQALARYPDGINSGALSQESVAYREIVKACMEARGFRLKENLLKCSGGDYRIPDLFNDCWEQA